MTTGIISFVAFAGIAAVAVVIAKVGGDIVEAAHRSATEEHGIIMRHSGTTPGSREEVGPPAK